MNGGIEEQCPSLEITEDEMIGWHHQLDGQAPGVGDGQESLACFSPWGRRVIQDWATELNWANILVL